MSNKNSTISGPSDTYAIAVDGQGGNVRSDDTAFDAGELSEFGSIGSIFTVYFDQPTQAEQKLLEENGIWGLGRLYSESTKNMSAYKKLILDRYIDIPRNLWRIINEQINFINKVENGTFK
jgi:hypothetical protein